MTMNLSGSLAAFGLGDVLTLLGMGGRTARMQVTSAAGVGAVHLVDGHVSAASADLTRAGLLRQLVAEAAVPATDLAGALEQAEPAAALVDSGVVSRDVAHRVAVEHIVDAVGEMLGWTDGEFAVWSGEADPADIGVRLPIGEALDRGRAREQEWARLREALPEAGSVLALAPELAQPVSLGAEDWSVLARVDGRRTLSEVLGASGIAPLVASDRLVQLMGRGLVRVRPDEVAAPDRVAELIGAFEAGPQPPEPVVPVVVSDVLVGPEEDLPAALPDPVGVPVAQEAAEMTAAAADVDAAEDAAEVAAEVGAQPDREPVPVPVLAEPIEVAAQPWDLPRPPVIEPDPAVAAWLESASSADELAALLGQADLGVPPLGAESLDGTATPAAPRVQDEAPLWVPVDAEPAVPPEAEAAVAPGIAWSPWAQALGLGAPAPEGELVVDPLAGPGIARMIADAHGLAETAEVPVPQAPVLPAPAGEPDGTGVALAGAAVVAEAPALPVPREPEGQTWAVEAVEAVEAAAAQEEAGHGDPVPVAPEPASPDPLAGGLLSQLMSGVRGL